MYDSVKSHKTTKSLKEILRYKNQISYETAVIS